MNKDIKNIEELDFIGQIKFYLQRIANDLINIANSYNQNTLNDLLSDLVKLEELVKKSQA